MPLQQLQRTQAVLQVRLLWFFFKLYLPFAYCILLFLQKKMCRCEAVKKEFYPKLFYTCRFSTGKCGVKSGCFRQKSQPTQNFLCRFGYRCCFADNFAPNCPQCGEGLKSVVGNLFVCLGRFSRSLSFATSCNVKAICIASAVVVCRKTVIKCVVSVEIS